jgi:hypothetical protein
MPTEELLEFAGQVVFLSTLLAYVARVEPSGEIRVEGGPPEGEGPSR